MRESEFDYSLPTFYLDEFKFLVTTQLWTPLNFKNPESPELLYDSYVRCVFGRTDNSMWTIKIDIVDPSIVAAKMRPRSKMMKALLFGENGLAIQTVGFVSEFDASQTNSAKD